MPYEELTTTAFHDQVLAGTTTRAGLVSWYLRRIADLDSAGPRIGSVVTVNPQALAEAEALDAAFAATGELQGPLHGVPVLIKDQAETAGIPTSFGSALFADYVPERDATVVTRLREAGAIVLAKTTMCDFAAGWFSFSSRSDHTKNPYALDREAGGSSAGTGAALTANLGLLGVGEDTGGSVRIPGSFTNLFGLRPTTGLVSRTGFSPLVHFQDTPGPMGRTVGDVAVLLDAMVGYDPADPFTAVAARIPGRQGSYVASLEGATLAGARVGVLSDAFGSSPEAKPVSALVLAATDELRSAGADVESLELPRLQDWIRQTAFYATQSREDLTSFLAARPAAPVRSLDEIFASGVFHPLTGLIATAAEGPRVAADAPDYHRMRVRQEEFRRALLHAMATADVDVLVFPTVQVPPPTRQELADLRWTAQTFPTNTVIASQSGLPAMTVPVGMTDDGLPVGMDVVGRPLAEAQLLRFALAWERHARPRRPPVLSDAVPETPSAATAGTR